MSKKRKTRKEKEKAVVRHNEYVHQLQVEAATYSIKNVESKKQVSAPRTLTHETTTDQKDSEYLKSDMIKISAASGVIVAVDILLFTLLTTGVLKLNFLGY